MLRTTGLCDLFVCFDFPQGDALDKSSGEEDGGGQAPHEEADSFLNFFSFIFYYT